MEYGSNNDNDYTLVQDNINLGKSLVSEFNINNKKLYIFYKLILSSGTTSNSPYTQEIEFKLSLKHYIINKSNGDYSLSEDGKHIVSTDINLIKQNNFVDVSLMKQEVFEFISNDNYNIISSD